MNVTHQYAKVTQTGTKTMFPADENNEKQNIGTHSVLEQF